MVDNFILREPEKLIGQYVTDPIFFFKQWFHSDTTKGEVILNNGVKGTIIETVINKNFTGNIAAYAYAQAVR